MLPPWGLVENCQAISRDGNVMGIDINTSMTTEG